MNRAQGARYPYLHLRRKNNRVTVGGGYGEDESQGNHVHEGQKKSRWPDDDMEPQKIIEKYEQYIFWFPWKPPNPQILLYRIFRKHNSMIFF